MLLLLSIRVGRPRRRHSRHRLMKHVIWTTGRRHTTRMTRRWRREKTTSTLAIHSWRTILGIIATGIPIIGAFALSVWFIMTAITISVTTIRFVMILTIHVTTIISTGVAVVVEISLVVSLKSGKIDGKRDWQRVRTSKQ